MAYDELRDSALAPGLTPAQQKRALKRARACVSGDADFLPRVRVISEREYRTISEGVRQRGRALRMFLEDHYFGERTYERSGLITKAQVEKIRSRYGSDVSSRPLALRPENIQFWYAPDTIRDEQGNIRVIEDNIGFVGGIGDLEAFAAAMKILGVTLSSRHHPRKFYEGMIARYRREARRCVGLSGSGRSGGASGSGRGRGAAKIVLLSYPKAQRWNHEDERLAKILRGLGVVEVTDFRKLRVREEGLFHGRERVGFVIVNVDYETIDPAGTSKHRIPNFWQAVSRGQLGVSYAPGIEFVGDKSLCPRVESLVKFYLNEKCLLPTLETLTLSNARSLRRVRLERGQWVIKLCKGQSGESVWVGNHLSAQMWSRLMTRVAKHPDDFIAQRFCEPSQFLEHAVDLRPLALISPEGETVSPIPWGRAARTKKSKTNISRGGLLAPIAVVPSIVGERD